MCLSANFSCCPLTYIGFSCFSYLVLSLSLPYIFRFPLLCSCHSPALENLSFSLSVHFPGPPQTLSAVAGFCFSLANPEQSLFTSELLAFIDCGCIVTLTLSNLPPWGCSLESLAFCVCLFQSIRLLDHGRWGYSSSISLHSPQFMPGTKFLRNLFG